MHKTSEKECWKHAQQQQQIVLMIECVSRATECTHRDRKRTQLQNISQSEYPPKPKRNRRAKRTCAHARASEIKSVSALDIYRPKQFCRAQKNDS